jgi:hypothetical protein
MKATPRTAPPSPARRKESAMSSKSVAGGAPNSADEPERKRVKPTPPAWRGKRKWVMVAVDFMESGKLLKAGPSAELLFIRMIARCGAKLSDGVLDEEYVLSLGRDLHGGPKPALAALRKVGLVTVKDGVVTLIGYLDHQWSLAQIMGALEADKARKAASSAAFRASRVASTTTTGTAAASLKVVAPVRGQEGFNPAADAACEYLVDALVALGGLREKVTSAWRTDMTDVLERLEELGDIPVEKVIDAALADVSFHRKNATEPKYFRKYLNKLVLFAKSPRKSVGNEISGLPTSTAAAHPHQSRRTTEGGVA